MLDKYIATTTYSVVVTLDALERHLDSELLKIIKNELHIESLNQSHLLIDNVNDGITFYYVEVSK